MTLNPESTQFGDRAVTPQEKTAAVRGVFDSVAGKYDLMNDLMSGGLHRLWKDSFVRMIRPRPGLDYLDVAGGTGDIAFRINRKIIGGVGRIAICDLNPAMLAVGRDRAIDRGWLSGFEWTAGNAESLPYPDHSFDVYTIAFGLRNVTHIDTALAEAFRVLRPGGRFYCLEFSHVQTPLLARAYDLYSKNAIPLMGKIIAKDEDSYKYLVESIRRFPSRKSLLKRMETAGFRQCRARVYTHGVVAAHNGLKP